MNHDDDDDDDEGLGFMTLCDIITLDDGSFYHQPKVS